MRRADTSTPSLFEDVAPTASEHFRLCFLGAVLRVMGQAAQSIGSRSALLEQYPFLRGYDDEFSARGLRDIGDEADDVWREALGHWETCVTEHLPLRAIATAGGLDYDALTLLLCIGLTEEDMRFGLLFGAMQGAAEQHRPTVGLLNAWWRPVEDRGEVRTRLRLLQEIGLVQVVNGEAPRLEWALQPVGIVWDALRGCPGRSPAPWLRWHSAGELLSADDLVLSPEARKCLKNIRGFLATRAVPTLVVRGPQRNGRRTVLGAVARALDRGLLEVTGLGKGDDERWRVVGPLATALHMMPALVFDLAPGETAKLPCLHAYAGPVGVVLGPHGGLDGTGVENAMTLSLKTPGPDERRLLWERSLQGQACDGLGDISARCRLTSGNIFRAATLAKSHTTLTEQPGLTPIAVREASRVLQHQALDLLASHVGTTGDWSHLAASTETFAELRALENRCRQRERLPGLTGSMLSRQMTPGVRALFTGPSGTGKTLAARLLAAALQMDLYRLDLASVVNKYIGETEKNLNQVFSRAEELDVILLLDEGDALMTQRTAVSSSNDRYANLETNFLLQRIESFDGILVVTTNAADRIDSAFQRRMDTVIHFRPPDLDERFAIWQMHLPPNHAVDPIWLGEVAARCALTGGQIRNAALHATLLSLDDGGRLLSLHLESAVQREYRKAGAVCPLRPLGGPRSP